MGNNNVCLKDKQNNTYNNKKNKKGEENNSNSEDEKEKEKENNNQLSDYNKELFHILFQGETNNENGNKK